MLYRTFVRLAAAAAFGAGAANAADVTVTSAKIEAGRLKITGTTLIGGTKVRLDGQTAAAFNVTSNVTTKAFSFNIVYHPGDCIVALQKVTPPSTLGAATNAVVADCGPTGVSPRGAWNAATPYLANDLVTSLGSSWRAKRNNLNKPPATSTTDWEKFAAAGAAGAIGPVGPVGPVGPQGPQGVAGEQGEQGEAGPQGPVGAAGPAGPSGPQGPAGPQGSQGAPGAQGPQGQAGSQGPQGATGATGGQGPQGPAGPAGVTPRGAWGAGVAYAQNDLVFHEGSTWRALRGSTDVIPEAANDEDWQLFARKGDQGEQGLQGATGPQGATGAQGPQGTQGQQGEQGGQGSQGVQGAQGVQGPQGPTGAQGLQGPEGPQGPAGAAGVGAGNWWYWTGVVENQTPTPITYPDGTVVMDEFVGTVLCTAETALVSTNFLNVQLWIVGRAGAVHLLNSTAVGTATPTNDTPFLFRSVGRLAIRPSLYGAPITMKCRLERLP